MNLSETYDINRKREIVDICLQKFIEKGLYETTSRDLTEALNMSPGALYYHFKNKDDAVLECAEEASIRLEELLLLPVLEFIDKTEALDEPPAKTPERVPAMIRFLAQVCTANKYREQMKPILKRMREREYGYCEKFAKKLGCTPEELAPWFFAAVASSESYLIFGQEAYSANPDQFFQAGFRLFKENLENSKI